MLMGEREIELLNMLASLLAAIERIARAQERMAEAQEAVARAKGVAPPMEGRPGNLR